MDIFIRILQLLASLSFLVVLHEFGHFLFARLFGVRVEKFYMFFNYRKSLLRAKKFNGKWHFRWFADNVEEPVIEIDSSDADEPRYRAMTEAELAALPEDDWRRYPESTEWGIGWIPLGGYCSICGMVDETKDASQLQAEPQPWEYRSQAIWKRMFIITGGVLFNLIGAMIIFGAMLSHWGEQYIPMSNAKYGEQYSELMRKYGFENGDKILLIDGEEPLTASEAVQMILIDGHRAITVARGSDTVDVILPDDFTKEVLARNGDLLFDIRFPFVVSDVVSGDAADKAGIMAGDSVVMADSLPLFAFQDITEYFAGHSGDSVELTIVRQGNVVKLPLQVNEHGKIGVYPYPPTHFIDVETKHYNFFSAIPAGIAKGWNTLVNYVKQMKYIFTSEGVKQVGGFGAIGKLFPTYWDWYQFWSMTALLSIILAFMNILPIPVLDGGYLLFLIYEAITGRKPGEKFMERASTIGFILLLALMIYANLNDIYKAFL